PSPHRRGNLRSCKRLASHSESILEKTLVRVLGGGHTRAWSRCRLLPSQPPKLQPSAAVGEETGIGKI
ncbi:hypothetical protein, partial [Pyrobaculum sp.]|uniref:hypothetical protein n=1 Tax=Pyrobaculum sp. TaxID=2004705 RepID=UPI003D122195